MPIYEFVCMRCEGRFEELLRMSDADPACPRCGATRVRRQLSVFAAGPSEPRAAGSGACACGGACSCAH